MRTINDVQRSGTGLRSGTVLKGERKERMEGAIAAGVAPSGEGRIRTSSSMSELDGTATTLTRNSTSN